MHRHTHSLSFSFSLSLSLPLDAAEGCGARKSPVNTPKDPCTLKTPCTNSKSPVYTQKSSVQTA